MPSQPIFTLQNRIGVGGFGEVYRALFDDTPCAAKCFFLAVSGPAQTMIQNEVAILWNLRHRHIIQFYRSHEHEGKLYLLMELAEKGNLANAIKTMHLDWSTKARLAHEIALGLEYIHQEGILHKDLKSANVLLTQHMEAKLGDFGLAEVRSSISRSMSSGACKGTVRWMAPELWAVKPKYSNKSDVFALGMVMWEMAANCNKPFKDHDNQTVLGLHIKKGLREVLPDDTPAEYRQWVVRCWDQDPAQRPEASEIVLAEFEPTPMPVYSSSSSLSTSVDQPMNVPIVEAEPKAESADSNSSNILLSTSIDQLVEVSTVESESADSNSSNIPLSTSIDQSMNVPIVEAEPKAESADSNSSNILLRTSINQSVDVPIENDLESESDKMATEAHFIDHSGNGVMPYVISTLTRIAEKDNVEAQMALAARYESGDGVDRSESKAFMWFHRAAMKGDAEAQRQLGRLFLDGKGTHQSDNDAVTWFRKAAEQGNAEAQERLAWLYKHGRGVLHSDAEAFKWYLDAANRGHSNAQFIVGIMYANGIGVGKDEGEAISWCLSAADQAHKKAKNHLGPMYLELDKAAENGIPSAQNTLGWLHENGRVVAIRSDTVAVVWYHKAASQGHAEGQFNLARMYEFGRGLPANHEQAASWYRKAALQGHAGAKKKLRDYERLSAKDIISRVFSKRAKQN